MFKRITVMLLIAVLVLCSSACSKESLCTPGEYSILNTSSLPKSISMEEVPEGGYTLYLDNTLIGGIVLLDLTEASKRDPYLYDLSDHLIEAAEDIIQQFAPAEYDHIASYGGSEYVKIDFVGPEGASYSHCIYEVDEGYCDIWYDQTQLSSEAGSQLAALYLPQA